MFKILFKIHRRINRKRATWWFKTINRYYVSTGKSVSIGKRVTVNPITAHSGELKLFFDDFSFVKNDVIFQGAGKVHLGKRSFIGSYSVIGANESVYIGDNCMIAQSVSIRDTDHEFSDPSKPMIDQGISTAAVRIEDNVWIGYGAVITKGLTIGSGSIIAANAVVTKDVEPNTIVGGVPARPIRSRYE